MENEQDVIKVKVRTCIICCMDYLLNTIENATYKEFKANRKKYEKAFFTSLNYIFGDLVNETFNSIAENKKLEKQKQKSIIEIFSKILKEWGNEYITEIQKFGNKNKDR